MVHPAFQDELSDLRHEFMLADGTPVVLCALSASGMEIRTRAALRVGQELSFELQLAGSGVCFAATGVVRRKVARTEPLFQVHFTHLELKPAA